MILLKINMPDIIVKHLGHIYTVIVISTYLYLKRKYLRLIFFTCVWKTRDNKDKIRRLSRRDYCRSARSKGKKIMLDLDWRNRGQRFFPVRRKTYVFLRYITDAPFLRLFANQPRRRSTHDVDGDDGPAQGGPVRSSLKIIALRSTSEHPFDALVGMPHDSRRYAKHRRIRI